jgi:hypothetical protein
MKKIIHNLRQKPEHVRRHILHLVTIICAIILIFLWIYSLSSNLSDGTVGQQIKDTVQPLTLQNNNS